MALPHLFPDIPELTWETQLYTQRKSNADPPANYKFTIQTLSDFLGEGTGLWFKNPANSLSPIQTPNQTNNIFLGFETANNFDFSNLATYSADHNFIAGYQLAGSLLSGKYNFIFGVDVADPLTTGSNNTLFGYNIFASITTGNYNFLSGYNLAPLVTAPINNFIQGSSSAALATTMQNNFINGRDIFNNSTDIRFSFANGYLLGNSVSTTIWYSLFNGNSNADNSANASYLLVNGFGNLRNVVNPNFSLVSGLSNVGTGSSSSVQYSTIIGRDNALVATGSVNHSGILGQDNLRSGIGLDSGFLSGYRNLFQTTSDIQNTIAMGRENGYNDFDHSYSILLGFRQNYSSGGTYRLSIGMAQDDPLISGHFTSDWVRIDGYLEVRDKTGTPGNFVAFDGDKLVDSGINSFSGDPDQTLSYSSSTNTVQISGSLSSVQLTQLAEEMELIGTSATYTYRALDTLGSPLGDALSINEGTNISIVRAGNILTFNATGSSLWTDTTSYGFDNYQPNNYSGFKIYDAGTVGIGIFQYPAQKLHVGGSILADQDIYATDDVIVGDDIQLNGTTSTITVGGSSGSTTELLGHNGTKLAWRPMSGILLSNFSNNIQYGYKMVTTVGTGFLTLTSSYTTFTGYNSTQYDTGGLSGSTSTGVITVNSTGLYQVTIRAAFSSTTTSSGDRIISLISINNDSISSGWLDRVWVSKVTHGDEETFTYTTTLYLSTNDDIRYKVGKSVGAGTITLAGASFEVIRIS